ncbi:unnamed protein product [Parascedosporium putredinis]|uniref:Uncharacterized protein n=1 Tax=Parascedosporium putredinis TaxID=1442378 RepID=A0A9P1M855_9PEZI|nr:unnamed protein product [Parascedosporium putredinis]CAI7992989.1 unnamed protein product [Parascedosporium putredinis]
MAIRSPTMADIDEKEELRNFEEEEKRHLEEEKGFVFVHPGDALGSNPVLAVPPPTQGSLSAQYPSPLPSNLSRLPDREIISGSLSCGPHASHAPTLYAIPQISYGLPQPHHNPNLKPSAPPTLCALLPFLSAFALGALRCHTYVRGLTRASSRRRA